MKCSILQRLQQDRPVLSVEFFPPKTPEAESQLLESAQQLTAINPDFASITYGAGGTTRERTLTYAKRLAHEFGYQVMPHLTCVGHSQAELLELLSDFATQSFPAIMALRGDPPKGLSNFVPHPDGLRYASDLVSLIRAKFPQFEIGVGGYPETHPEAKSATEDLHNLGIKLGAGSDFITTQLFLDNAVYHQFVRRIRELGHQQPVLPGVLIPLSLDQLERFAGFCKASIPSELRRRLQTAGSSESAQTEVGIEWAFEQSADLLSSGAPGIHLYILNRFRPALALFEKFRQAKFIS
ncbi:MAG: methylenetetrahydrofolate reductase [Puniceicoccaceae bacterium]